MFLKKILRHIKKRVVREIAISECVHYCGFAYGKNAFNPYEQYCSSIVRDENPAPRRQQFIDFLRFYRPKTMAAALGYTSADQTPLWVYPWYDWPVGGPNINNGWVDDPDDVPDLLTHFSDKGILEWRILEEFCWLERAFNSVQRHGYQPEKYGCFACVLPLIRKNNERRYLVLDGNHRISALSALGKSHCVATIEKEVREENVSTWPGVVAKFFSPESALIHQQALRLL